MTIDGTSTSTLGQENAVSEDSLVIPLIDFSRFLEGTQEEKLAISKAMVEGFKTAGFIYLKNYGVAPEVVAEVFAESAKFFALSQEEKDAIAWYSARANRGYVSHGREKVTNITDKTAVDALRSQNPDIKESLEIGRSDELAYPNLFPPDEVLPGFRPTMITFFDTLKSLHATVMSAIALGMSLPEHFFDPFCRVGDNTLRLLHYPKADAGLFKRKTGTVRAGAHTDYGSITLLFQDMRGGLQVLSPRGRFVDAVPIEGTLVVNAGDLLTRWSNDTIKSTEHRVVEPPTEPDEDGFYPARYSIAYFCNPDFDRDIEALPGTYASEADIKYPKINSGEYLTQRLESTYL